MPGAVPDFIPVMAPFIPLWNECRRHLGLAGRLQPSRHVESGAMRTACSLAPSDARNTRRPPSRHGAFHSTVVARKLALLGATESEMADALNINVRTLS